VNKLKPPAIKHASPFLQRPAVVPKELLLVVEDDPLWEPKKKVAKNRLVVLVFCEIKGIEKVEQVLWKARYHTGI